LLNEWVRPGWFGLVRFFEFWDIALLHRISEILSEFGREKRSVYSLDNIRLALEAVGNPQSELQSLIVGGTNGKGTSSVLLTAGLVEAGFKVHTYLSPHLYSPTERFLENGIAISEPELEQWLESQLEIARKFKLSYFEVLTLISFLRAKQAGADFLVLEVGLGGRLDATNLCDPIASLIATVDLDHQEILGDTVSKILDEKLQIVRPEGLLFTGIRDEGLVQQIEKYCMEVDAIPYYSRELSATVQAAGVWGQRVLINGYTFELSCPTFATLENAKTSLLLLRILFPKISLDVWRAGFRRAVMPARFEFLQQSPRVILSGDHNPQAMTGMLASLAEYKTTGKLHTLAAFSVDKNYDEMIPLLKQASDTFTLAALSGAVVPDSYATYGVTEGKPAELAAALLARCTPEDTLLIAGSLYLAGEVRPVWSHSIRFLLSDEEVLRRYSPLPDPAIAAKAPTGAKVQMPGRASEGEARLPHRLPTSTHRTPVNLNP